MLLAGISPTPTPTPIPTYPFPNPYPAGQGLCDLGHKRQSLRGCCLGWLGKMFTVGTGLLTLLSLFLSYSHGFYLGIASHRRLAHLPPANQRCSIAVYYLAEQVMKRIDQELYRARFYSGTNALHSLYEIDFAAINETIEEWTRPMPLEYLRWPLVVAGPSGVGSVILISHHHRWNFWDVNNWHIHWSVSCVFTGKNRLIRALLKDYGKYFKKIVTHTTRQPRPGEINGTDYHFVSKEVFFSLNCSGQFIEASHVHNNYYGVSRHAMVQVEGDKKISIFEVWHICVCLTFIRTYINWLD